MLKIVRWFYMDEKNFYIILFPDTIVVNMEKENTVKHILENSFVWLFPYNKQNINFEMGISKDLI